MDKILFSLVFFYYVYTIGLLYYMFLKRKKALVSGEVPKSYFKTYQGGGTAELAVLQNHFNNQFQLPIFFFITCIVAKIFHATDTVTVGLAFWFVASRLLHSYIHLTKNHLIYRATSFFAGILLLGAMWVYVLTNGY